MITNPKIGMRVKWIGGPSCREGHSGVIIQVADNGVIVDFGQPLGNTENPHWWCLIEQLSLEEPTPEELDAQKRREHAAKYL